MSFLAFLWIAGATIDCAFVRCSFQGFILRVFIFFSRKVLILNMLAMLIVLGFVAAHTLPVLYERYDDQVDGFVYNAFQQFQGHYQKLDRGVLSRFPTGKFRLKKFE